MSLLWLSYGDKIIEIWFLKIGLIFYNEQPTIGTTHGYKEMPWQEMAKTVCVLDGLHVKFLPI